MKIFGLHKIPFSLKQEGFSLSVEIDKDNVLYKRLCGSNEFKKLILAKKFDILIHPVEPLNLPKNISSYLLILFTTPIMVNPKSSRTVFIKFPIEIGIFISTKSGYESIDIMTLTKQKYTLYGDPRNGVICRYFESEVYSILPSPDIYKEGVIELKIKNSSPEWITVNHTVLSGYGMKIFFNETRIIMHAEMDIQHSHHAETDFKDTPFDIKLEKSQEMFLTRKLPLITSKFIMRDGF